MRHRFRPLCRTQSLQRYLPQPIERSISNYQGTAQLRAAGLTFILLQAGRSIILDATIIGPLADSEAGELPR